MNSTPPYQRHLYCRSVGGVELASDYLARWGLGATRWHRAVLECFGGKLAEKALLAFAAEEDRKETGLTTKEKLCEGYFYVGMMEISSGHVEAGEEFLRKCAATGVTHYVEYEAAKTWLARPNLP